MPMFLYVVISSVYRLSINLSLVVTSTIPHSTHFILLGQLDSSQHLMDNGERLRLGYSITKVKMPFLYDFTFEKLYENRITIYSYEARIRYEESDAAVWVQREPPPDR
ncbi:MAG: hypothetical protein IJA67_06570 [Oscillospiraceae bacterium]|nr:hypothetical protein [Oscillospiraceae bacterium]